jgi:Salmonella virulence plasmid 65kDa B protein
MTSYRLLNFTIVTNSGSNMVVRKDRSLFLRAFRNVLWVLFTTSIFFVHIKLHAAPLGQESVSSSGAAIYSIPLRLSSGAFGFLPNFELVYNSQAGDGEIGVGWSLSGLQSIKRCPKEKSENGISEALRFDSTDDFCLNGGRLKLVSGGVSGAAVASYRLENDSYSTVDGFGFVGSMGGPSSFLLKSKEGVSYYFGGGDDARIEAKGSVVGIWLLKRVVDQVGNYYEINYVKDGTGLYWVSGVKGAAFEVVFNYISNDLPSLCYQGLCTGSGRLLKRIDFLSNSLVRYYSFEYKSSILTKRNILSALKDCDSSGCAPQVDFGWASSLGGWSHHSSSSIGGWGGRQYFQFDANDDGRDDVVEVYHLDNGEAHVSVWGQGASGFSYVSGSRIGEWDDSRSYYSGDVNGDGRQDIVEIYSVEGGNKLATQWISRGDGSFRVGAPGCWVGGVRSDTQYFLQDLDGDGAADLMEIWSDAGKAYLTFWKSPGDGCFVSPVVEPTILVTLIRML